MKKYYIYIAAPISQATIAGIWAETLKKLGHGVVSSWHSTIFDTSKDPHEIETRQSVLARNLGDLNMCNLVLAVCSDGHPRATFSEIGWALSKGRPVIWRQRENNEGGNIFDAHPNVFIATSDEMALHHLTRISG